MNNAYERLRFAVVLVTLIALTVALARSTSAHNTNTTHPRITASGLELIKTEDVDVFSYAQMYQEIVGGGNNVYLYWGDDPRFNANQAGADAGNGYPAFEDVTTMGGIVREDDPFGRVLSHFYNAYTGERMPLATGGGLTGYVAQTGIGAFDLEYSPSKETAYRFFDMSIEVYGYNDTADGDSRAARALGYWLFGKTLHHLEDMDSIAHVSSDPHLILPFGGPWLDSDDFEGAYVPTFLWNNTGPIPGYFGNGAPASVTSINQIWPQPSPATAGLETNGGTILANSLARTVYNAGVYQATLPYHPNTPDIIMTGGGGIVIETACVYVDGQEYCNPADVTSLGVAATGELQDMFIDPNSSPGDTLRWLWPDKFTYAHWNIAGIGDYRYQEGFTVFGGPNSWWSVRAFDGPCVEASCTGAEYFYVEQVMRGVDGGDAFDPANLVVPFGMRGVYDLPWHPVTNRVMTGNTRSILEILAERLLPLGPQYAAGFAKHWYDIVNTPPYLRRVVVRQEGEKKYEAEWKPELETGRIDLAAPSFLQWGAPEFDFEYEARRILDYGIEVAVPEFMHSDSGIELVLTFNEPIQTPTAMNFSLALGATSLSFGSYTITKQPQDFEGQTLDKPWNEGTEWLVQIPASQLNGLDGRITLAVMALDKNNHWGGIGSSLDDDPATPARRQRFNASSERQDFVGYNPAWEQYQWHTTDSRDRNFEDMEPGDFAYTYGEGDQTHVLFFDSSSPEIDGTINIQN